MTVSSLLARGIRAVVIERDENTVRSMMLDDEYAHVPALVARAGDRISMEMAGLYKNHCQGVIATTNDDHVNLTIAITSKLLRPDLAVLARSENQRVCDNMASFGTDAIVNPYRIFSERLSLALSSPIKYLVQDWLISVPGSELREVLRPPIGRWIVCGAGRFGARMVEQLEESALPVTVVDVHPERLPRYEHAILGRGTEVHTLKEAGIDSAVGIIAGTGDDIDNLSIIMTARHLNPDLFFIARQERKQHDELFDSAKIDLIARRNLIVARRILSIVSTPLLQSFLQHLFRSDDEFAERTAAKLQDVLQNRAPSIWVYELKGEIARTLRFVRSKSSGVCLEHIMYNSRSEERYLPAVITPADRYCGPCLTHTRCWGMSVANSYHVAPCGGGYQNANCEFCEGCLHRRVCLGGYRVAVHGTHSSHPWAFVNSFPTNYGPVYRYPTPPFKRWCKPMCRD
jgi:Trk K+ transport system NAD-binding subunit